MFATHLTSTGPHRLRAARNAAGVVPALALLAAIFVAGHVPFITATHDGIDSANFVLAVDRYDPEQHQPHPPGFPVHVAMGRLVTRVYDAIDPGAPSGIGAAAEGLRVWSVIAGAVALLSLTSIAIALGASLPRSVLVAALTAACPLFWLTSMRPVSDVPGLCFALLSQALAFSACRREHFAATSDELYPGSDRAVTWAGAWSPSTVRLLAAGFVAGVGVGVRVQTSLIAGPLLLFATAIVARRQGTATLARVPIAIALGILTWAVPMMYAVGGIDEYVRLLTTVATDDFEGVEMLATNPSPRLLALGLIRTFITPWNSPVLGACVFVMASIGAVVLARRNRRALTAIALIGLPYLAFHLLFQESESVRYSLPLVPVVAVLAVAALPVRPRALAASLAGVLLVAAFSLTIEATSRYTETSSPAARVMSDVRRQAASRPQPPVLAFHHAVERAVRGEPWNGTTLHSDAVRYEWLELTRYWLDGGKNPIWFLADDRRTDLALVDPHARRRVASYRWPEPVEALLGGAQPLGVSWHEIAAPGWFLMRGWSLTAETHGVATRDGHSPGTTGIVGYVKRRTGGAVMIIGGRHAGDADDAGATIELSIDGRPRQAWVVSPQSRFLQTIRLAPGELAGRGDYAPVSIRAWDVSGVARRVEVAIDSFDVQSAGVPVLGVGPGWHLPELNPDTGTTWRWTDEAAQLRVDASGTDVELVIRGESPLRYFQTAPTVVLRAGDIELATFEPDADFEWVVPIPAAVLAASDGRLVLESNRWFIPDETSGNGDRRRLALRLYQVEAR